MLASEAPAPARNQSAAPTLDLKHAAQRAGRTERSVRRRVEPRCHVYLEGDQRAFLYEIESGVVKLYRTLANGDRQVVAFLGAGDLFGFEPGDEHLTTAEAVTPVELSSYSLPLVQQLCAAEPGLCDLLLREAARQLILAQAQLVAIGAQSATERVAGFILALWRSRATRGGDVVDMPMRRSDLAEFLGLRLETVSRVMSDLNRRGIIKLVSTYRLQVLRPAVLQALGDSEDVAEIAAAEPRH
jgi:CRP/FNR family transcriptional regulator